MAHILLKHDKTLQLVVKTVLLNIFDKLIATFIECIYRETEVIKFGLCG